MYIVYIFESNELFESKSVPTCQCRGAAYHWRARTRGRREQVGVRQQVREAVFEQVARRSRAGVAAERAAVHDGARLERNSLNLVHL